MSNLVRRADLEAQAVSYPDYLGAQIFPWWGKEQEAGTYYYRKYMQDVAAQYDRDYDDLAAISSNTVKNTTDTFVCKELRSRQKMSYAQLKGYKDKAVAEMVMGRLAKRAWFNKHETLVADKVLNVLNPIDGTSDVVAALDENVTKIRDLGIGKVGIVLSNHVKVALKNNATIKDRMKATGVAPMGLDPRAIADGQLAAIFGADAILTGRDDIWFTGLAAGKGNAAIVVLPEEGMDPCEFVELGRTIYFAYDDAADDRFVMESWHDDDLDADVVDAKGLICLKQFNAELCKTVTLFDLDESSSSSI